MDSLQVDGRLTALDPLRLRASFCISRQLRGLGLEEKRVLVTRCKTNCSRSHSVQNTESCRENTSTRLKPETE